MIVPPQLVVIMQPLMLLMITAILLGAFLVIRVERGWDTTAMFTGALLSFISQVSQYLPVLFYAPSPVMAPGEYVIVASGPTLYPWYMGLMVSISTLGGLLFAGGFVAYALRKRLKRNVT